MRPILVTLLLTPVLLLAAPTPAPAPAATNSIVNGDLKGTGTGAPGAPWFLGKAATIEEENGNPFLRIESPQGGTLDGRFNQTINLPEGAKTLTVRVSSRVKKYRRGASGEPAITVFFRDTAGENLAIVPAIALKGKADWTKLNSAALKVPKGTTAVMIEGSVATSGGTFEFDDFEAVFQ